MSRVGTPAVLSQLAKEWRRPWGGDAVTEPCGLAAVGEGVVDQGGGDDPAPGAAEHQRIGWCVGRVVESVAQGGRRRARP